MKTDYECIYIRCSFTFEELLEIHKEITLLKEYGLQRVVIDALWKYYSEKTYTYIQQLMLTNQYNQTLTRHILGLDDFIERSVGSRYQISLPEEELLREEENLSTQYKELVEEIRVHNVAFGEFNFNSKADDMVVQLFKDAKLMADQVSGKKIKVEFLGELFWMEGLLIATWDYIRIRKKKFKKMDRYLKRYIIAYAGNEKLDELTRNRLIWDYSEESFKILDSWEFRYLQFMDSTWKLSSRLIRRLFGRGKSEREKKLEKLRKLIDFELDTSFPVQ